MIVGTRPEAIKLAPLAWSLLKRRLPVALLLTGQHRDLDPFAFGFPDLPSVFLRCAAHGDPERYSEELAAAIAPRLRGALVAIVQGDTSSALGGALAASRAGIPVAHVEAGLRTHDPRLPWPEEGFRAAIDGLSDLLFAPTELGAANLRREGRKGRICVTGNTAIDALRRAPLAIAPSRAPGPRRLLVTCHRRESWGERLAGIASALTALAADDDVEIRFVLHINPAVADAMRAHLAATPGVRLLPPLDHGAMLGEMANSDLLLSDSGGMQEEAPLLGLPMLVLRDRTERPEALATGNILLVGTDPHRIVRTVRRLLGDPAALERMRLPASPYGDGRAAEHIADHLAAWLDLPQATRAA